MNIRLRKPLASVIALSCLLTVASGVMVAQRDYGNMIRVEQRIRRSIGGRIPVRTYATIAVPANTLQSDTTIVAELNLDDRTLNVSTLEGYSLSGRVGLEINFDQFPSGLTIQFSGGSGRYDSARTATFVGTVTNMDPQRRSISVESTTDFREFFLGPTSMITRQENDLSRREVPLESLAIGDVVTVRYFSDSQTAQAIEAKYKMISGVVRTVTSRRMVLNPNVTYQVNQNVMVTDVAGDQLAMTDLRPGQRVIMRLNPVTNEVWEISLGRLQGTSAVIQQPLPLNGVQAPRILSPQDGETVGSSVVVKGMAPPNSRVLLKIAFVRKGIVISRGALPDIEVKADAQGNFQTEPIGLKGPRLLEESIDYTIKCYAIRPDGKQTEEAVVTIIRQ